jgi:HK97 family phage major capsid protein
LAESDRRKHLDSESRQQYRTRRNPPRDGNFKHTIGFCVAPRARGAIMNSPNELVDIVRDGLSGVSKDFSGFKGEIGERIAAIEQRLSKSTINSTALFGGEIKSIGSTIIESDAYKSFIQSGARNSGRIDVGSFFKTALVNADGQNQPLVPAYRVPGIVGTVQRRLTIRDILPAAPASSNSIEYCRETSFTNNAAPQGAGSSPLVRENVAKAESGFTFQLLHQPVETLAHWLPVSRQALDDAPALQAYINGRLLYGLKLKEEDELLNGTGTNNSLSGLVENSTAYDTGDDEANDTKIDTLRHAIRQVEDSDFEPDFIVISKSDWELIELTKTDGTGVTSGQYIITDPRRAGSPTLWGLPVVATNSMDTGKFLVGSSSVAMLWDRMQATVEISREHSDFFVKNMAAILCESRLSLTVFNSLGLIYGSFPA